jgi:hypothetical protein
VPASLKIFLTSIAIFDDLAAIIIIAVFYSVDLSTGSLAAAGAGIAVLFMLNRMGVFGMTALVVGLGIANKPTGASWGKLYGIAQLPSPWDTLQARPWGARSPTSLLAHGPTGKVPVSRLDFGYFHIFLMLAY